MSTQFQHSDGASPRIPLLRRQQSLQYRPSSTPSSHAWWSSAARCRAWRLRFPPMRPLSSHGRPEQGRLRGSWSRLQTLLQAQTGRERKQNSPCSHCGRGWKRGKRLQEVSWLLFHDRHTSLIPFLVMLKEQTEGSNIFDWLMSWKPP